MRKPKKRTTKIDFEALKAALMLSPLQASFLLGTSEKTVYRLVQQGELICRRIGRLVRIPRTSVDAFLKRDHRTGEENRPQRTEVDVDVESPRSKPSGSRGSR